MDNSADNKPLGGNNWWAIVESQIADVEKQERLNLAEKRKNLTLDIFVRNALQEEKRDWDLCMPIPYSMCKDVVEGAKILDRKRLRVKHFSSYKMNEGEEDLFDLLFEFGQALGIEEVMHTVKHQAISEGCTKSQKMYLDYVAAINLEEDVDKGLVNLNINLTNGDVGTGPKEKEVGESGSGSGSDGDEKNVVIDMHPES